MHVLRFTYVVAAQGRIVTLDAAAKSLMTSADEEGDESRLKSKHGYRLPAIFNGDQAPAPSAHISASVMHSPPPLTTTYTHSASSNPPVVALIRFTSCLRNASAKVKRLYDIANILTSLGLISKVGVQSVGRKPAFRWRAVGLVDIQGGQAPLESTSSRAAAAEEATPTSATKPVDVRAVPIPSARMQSPRTASHAGTERQNCQQGTTQLESPHQQQQYTGNQQQQQQQQQQRQLQYPYGTQECDMRCPR